MALVRTTGPKKVIPLVSPHVNNLSLQSPADDDAPALCDVQRKVPTGCYVSLRNGCLPAHGIGVASAYGRPAKAALISVHCPSNLCSNCTSLRLWTASGQGPVVFALCSFRSDCNRRNRPVLLRDNLHHQQPFGNSSSVFTRRNRCRYCLPCKCSSSQWISRVRIRGIQCLTSDNIAFVVSKRELVRWL